MEYLKKTKKEKIKLSTLMKKITAVMVVLSIIASIALIAVCADTPAIENKVLYDFDSLSDVPDSISSTSKLTLNSLAVYCENRTGKSLKATVASGTVFEIKTPAGEAFEGQGITFWYKTTGTKKAVFKVALVTKDNKQFEMSENLVCENKDGAAVLLEYADFAYSGAAITEGEIADIDFLRLTAIDGTTASTTLYLDTISLKLKDAEPAPTYTVLESVDMSKVKLINGKYTELSADAKTFTWTVKDEAVYAEEKIGEYIEIPVKNIKDLVSKRDAAYMIMEVRAPRQTKLTFSLTNADDTKKYGVDVGAMQNVTDADGFVKVKVALADFNVGFQE